ncbi:hypothetical protein NPIL_365261, partial [Nephila pilipes]
MEACRFTASTIEVVVAPVSQTPLRSPSSYRRVISHPLLSPRFLAE